MKPIKFKLSISKLAKMFPATSVLSWERPVDISPKHITRVLHIVLNNAAGIKVRAHIHWHYQWAHSSQRKKEAMAANAVTLFFENDDDAIEFKLRFM
jgi:hypothetical protein